MQLFKLYFTPALLLLILSCFSQSKSLPVMSEGQMTNSCVSYAQILLQNITDALLQGTLFHGVDCTTKGVELYTETNTSSVCAPKGSTCSGIAKSEFSQTSCLTNIGEDLRHYYKLLAKHPDRLLGQTVLFSLRQFMEVTNFTHPLSWLSLMLQTAADRSTYDERLTLCKVLKGFQVRAITISRVIGYMNSGEHTK
uniref:Interleukin-12 subunit alpha n=1 Tax=Lates calcarifer TaxID=8187 RepID=A0A4W6E0A5_LATCA